MSLKVGYNFYLHTIGDEDKHVTRYQSPTECLNMESLILVTLDSLAILKQYLDCPDDRQRITRMQKELVYILKTNHGESNGR